LQKTLEFEAVKSLAEAYKKEESEKKEMRK
jgi:hypothetical protein